MRLRDALLGRGELGDVFRGLAPPGYTMSPLRG